MPNPREPKRNTPRFAREQVLEGQADSITTLAFSPTGDLLASGSEDCSVILWEPLTGTMKRRILLQSAVTSLSWGLQGRVFIGCLDGTLVVAKNLQKEMSSSLVLTGTKSAISAIAVDLDSGHIAFGAGSELHMAKEIGCGTYATFKIFPSPHMLPNTLPGMDTRIRARALSFQDKGAKLMAAYLNHGIVCWDVGSLEALWQITPIHTHRFIGHAIVLPDKRLAVSNLCDGADLYDEGQSHPQLRLKHPPSSNDTNVVLQLTSIVDGKITCGSSDGRVPVWDTATGELLQLLEHEGQLVQAVAATDYPTCAIIATATSGNQENIRIILWKLPHARLTTKVCKHIRWYIRTMDLVLRPMIQHLFMNRISIFSVIVISIVTFATAILSQKVARLDNPMDSVTHSSREVLSGIGITIKDWGQGHCATFRRGALSAVEYVHELLQDGENSKGSLLEDGGGIGSGDGDMDMGRSLKLASPPGLAFHHHDPAVIYL